MSNRIYNPVLALTKQEVILQGNFVVGAAGAVGTIKGVKSVVHNSTGNYTITLEDHYDYLVAAKGGFVSAAVGGSGIASVEISNSPATLQADFKANAQYSINMFDYNGALADPAAGSVHSFQVHVRRSTVGSY